VPEIGNEPFSVNRLHRTGRQSTTTTTLEGKGGCGGKTARTADGDGQDQADEAIAALGAMTPDDLKREPAVCDRGARALAAKLRSWRPETGRSEYPANDKDRRDLRLAARCAVRLRKVGELLVVLRETAKWADNGGGFRNALRKAGFLHQAPDYSPGKRDGSNRVSSERRGRRR
jgi:hypothetical protein